MRRPVQSQRQPGAVFRPANPDTLPNAVTDVRLVHDMGGNIRNRKQLSRHEIASLLDSAERAKKPKKRRHGAPKRKSVGQKKKNGGLKNSKP